MERKRNIVQKWIIYTVLVAVIVSVLKFGLDLQAIGLGIFYGVGLGGIAGMVDVYLIQPPDP
jgi:hypothetical protein